MIKKIIFFTFFAISLFFISTYIQKFQKSSQASIQAQNKQKIQKEQESLIQTGEFSDGAKLYNDELREDCKMSGYTLARKKTKTQWEEIAKKGKLADTITSICPEVDFNNLWTPDIYEYLYKNAIASSS
jgi:hypothetical protein